MLRQKMIIMLMAAGCVLPAAAQTTQPAEPESPALPEIRPILSPEAKQKLARERIDRFVKHVEQSDAFPDAARRAVREGWQQFRDDEHPEDFMTAGIAILSEPFKKSIDALAREDYQAVDATLAPLMKHADPYISLHARATAARSLVEQDKLEEAQTILEPLAGQEKDLIDKTFLEAEVDFLLGYCQLANLQYDKAIESLTTFQRQHPDAPERLQLPARQMLQELLVRQPEGLGDVSDLMVYSGRRLYNGHPGKPVQIRQKQAVDLLTRLIKKAEEQEQQQGKCKNCGGKGCKKCQGTGKSGPPQGNQQPSSPANQSSIAEGESRIGSLEGMHTARPGEVWGQMRPEERERIMQSLRQNFPAQYRQLVEQYYKQLAKEQ